MDQLILWIHFADGRGEIKLIFPGRVKFFQGLYFNIFPENV